MAHQNNRNAVSSAKEMGVMEEISPLYRRKVCSWNDLLAQFNECNQVLQESRNTTKKLDVGGLLVVIKAFKAPHSMQAMIYTYCRKSKARRSYEHAMHLMKLGIGTHLPIAYREDRQNGKLCNSYFASEFIDYDFSIRDVLKQGDSADPDIIKSFVNFTFSLHRAGVLHLDYTPGNILIKQSDEGLSFFLIDINRMKFGDVSEKKGIENFFNLTKNKKILRMIAEFYSICRDSDSEKYYEMLNARSKRQVIKKKITGFVKKISGRRLA